MPAPSSSVAPLARPVETNVDVAPSLRLEQGFGQGAQIGVFYDPMIAKLVVHGRDRTEALRLLRGALDKYQVVGVSTNIEFLRTLAGNDAFIGGDLETGFIRVSYGYGKSLSEEAGTYRSAYHIPLRQQPTKHLLEVALQRRVLQFVIWCDPVQEGFAE